MGKMKLILFIMILLCDISFLLKAQSSKKGDPNMFPEYAQPDIPGAPKLRSPQLIMGSTTPVMGEGMGWAAPAVWDWDGDGKQDLLIGELSSGLEHGNVVGSFIRIYRNVGSNVKPEFTDKFRYGYYASYPHDVSPNGTPISVNTWCCLGFTPQFVDLDNDGLEDLISGQYNPGEVTWFRNTSNGFQAGIKLEQAGDSGAKKSSNLLVSNPKSWIYWNYSSANFGDFDDDGDYDLITGGTALRISENIGSKTKPRFGFRKPLLDINSTPLRGYQPTLEEIEKYPDFYRGEVTLTVPLVVDWDEDDVLDLMVTTDYTKKGQAAVMFFRGVKTHEGHRFEPGKPLFSIKDKDADKAFPGSWLRVYVTDWNSDGVNDLLIGTSVATLNGGEFDHDLSWSWESDTKIVKKNPGLNYEYEKLEYVKKQIEQAKKYPENSEKLIEQIKERYGYVLSGGDPSLVHRGYVYVMLGEKR